MRDGWNLLAQQTVERASPGADPAEGGTYWTDGWDGYTPSRQRLLQAVVRAPGGQPGGAGRRRVTRHYVADLKTDFDDSKAAVVASEFCGHLDQQPRACAERIDAARRFNPHVTTDDPTSAATSACAGRAAPAGAADGGARANDPASQVDVAARFTVEAGWPARTGLTATAAAHPPPHRCRHARPIA